jgi:hypothetical protein
MRIEPIYLNLHMLEVLYTEFYVTYGKPFNGQSILTCLGMCED